MSVYSGSQAASAIVIGGGVVGASCALALQARGVCTLVIDEGSDLKPASAGNAGHIAVEQVEPLASLAMVRGLPRRLFSAGGALALPPREIRAWLPFALRLLAAASPSRFRAGSAALATLMVEAMPAWRRLLARCDAADLLIERGHFVVWETQSGAAAGREALARADTGLVRVREAIPDEIKLLSRAMARPPARAVRFKGTGQIADLDVLADTLERSIRAGGGRRVRARALGIEYSNNRVSVRCDDGVSRCADAVIVAAGIGSTQLLQTAGYRVPMIAERGYHLQADAPSWPVDLPPIVFEERSMIVTGFRSGVRAASFVEFCRPTSRPDPRKWNRLRNHVLELGLPFQEPMMQWYGSRPTLPDYLPAIGRCRGPANLFYAFGHQHLGLTLAATSAEAVGALVLGEALPFDLSPFDLNRFQGRF